MKKYYQYFGLALIMAFSFYYTEKISLIVLNKNPLMVTINKEAENYNVTSVNAMIQGDYIIPGINGLQVNASESFHKMKELDVFNKYFLVYDQVEPEVSLEKNKNKLIKAGNSKLKKVSFILEKEGVVSDYFKSNQIKANLLVDLDSYQKNSYFEVINNEVDGFKSLENTLNLSKENSNLCVINDYNKDKCLKVKNYLLNPDLKLTSTNYIDIKNHLNNGSIIYITKTAKLSEIKQLIKEISYKDLEIVYVSELISEVNNNY